MGGAMEPPAISFVTSGAEADTRNSGNSHKSIRVVVPRSRAYLVPLLAKALEGRQDIEIVMDPRAGEPGGRQSVKKRPKEEDVIEVVIREPLLVEEPREGTVSSSGTGADRV